MSAKPKDPKRVRGRVRVRVCGAAFWFELRVTGITVRRVHSRKRISVPIENLANLAKPQPELFRLVETNERKT